MDETKASHAQTGVSCLFVHGWGMNHSIWQPLLEVLPDWIETKAVDLPGHGLRHNETLTDLQRLGEDLAEQCFVFKKKNRPLILVGWSLGGLACLKVATDKLAPIDGLLLVSTNPCFVSRPGWDVGVEGKIFDQFAKSLHEDFSGTIRRFLSLQVKGSDTGRRILRGLREKVLQQPQPGKESLDAGLQILRQADLRLQLKNISQPVSWVLGVQDGLVKVELAQALKMLMPQIETEIDAQQYPVEQEPIKKYPRAGHAAFLSHTDKFTQQLTEFLNLVRFKTNSGLK